jgi:hypothetical protein
MRVLGHLPGLNVVRAGLLISLVASLAAAWALYAIGDLIRGRRFGIILAALWAVVPACFAENAVLTESLFTALCAWALYAVLRRRWLVAGLLTMLCGLTRPTAVALVGAVGLAALVAVVRRRDGWRPYVGGLLAPVGYVGYLLYSGSRLGGVTGFFTLQRDHWSTYFDYGRFTAQTVGRVLFGSGDAGRDRAVMWCVMVAIGAVFQLVMLLFQRVPWVLTVFAVVMVVEALGSRADFTGTHRHLLPVFPLLFPIAAVLSRPDTRRARFAMPVTLCGVALLSGWYGGWLELSWINVV